MVRAHPIIDENGAIFRAGILTRIDTNYHEFPLWGDNTIRVNS
jgi:hypothetical protein